LKHEVLREAVEIPFDSLDQHTRFDLVQLCQWLSSITLWPRIRRIRRSMISTGTKLLAGRLLGHGFGFIQSYRLAGASQGLDMARTDCVRHG
jgi:hypothetical protein